MDGQPMMEIERPRSAAELINATSELFRLLPLLFLALAAVVVVPYWLIVVAATGEGPLTLHHPTWSVDLVIQVTQVTLVTPLISALHVHAVDDVARGERPALRSVGARSLGTLPVVSAAVAAATLGTFAGLVALVVPGVFLWIRWAVVAQAAALEEGGWLDALKRSGQLGRGNYPHVFGVLILACAFVLVVSYPLTVAFRHQSTSVGTVLVGLAVETVASSFFALATALLYFDLRSRLQLVDGRRLVDLDSPAPGTRGHVPMRAGAEPTGHPLDPASYSDAERPHGWYIDPVDPSQMAFWSGHDQLGWTPNRARTPKKTLADWVTYKTRRPGPPVTPAGTPGPAPVEPTGHPLDPDNYTDADRPPGWYVIPDAPWKMRYWSGGDPATGWSNRTTKTPKQTLDGWWKVGER